MVPINLEPEALELRERLLAMRIDRAPWLLRPLARLAQRAGVRLLNLGLGIIRA